MKLFQYLRLEDMAVLQMIFDKALLRPEVAKVSQRIMDGCAASRQLRAIFLDLDTFKKALQNRQQQQAISSWAKFNNTYHL